MKSDNITEIASMYLRLFSFIVKLLSPIKRIFSGRQITVELQWVEHLWDHRKLFEIWVVRATEG